MNWNKYMKINRLLILLTIVVVSVGVILKLTGITSVSWLVIFFPIWGSILFATTFVFLVVLITFIIQKIDKLRSNNE